MYTLSPSSTMPILPTLATELVEIVSHYLERTDLFSLRLVCKALYEKSLCTFGAQLTTIRTDLSQASLQRLQALSTHDLRLCVKRLLIEPREHEKLGQGFQWHRCSSGHLDVLSPGPQALGHLVAHNLPNCRSLHIRSPGGTEDGPDTLTHSDAVGFFLLLVPSLPTTSPVTSFIVDTTAHACCFLDTKKLPMAEIRQPSFLNAWAYVRELVIEQTLTPETVAWSLSLVLHATGLRVLSLDLGFGQSEAFVERLCAAESALRSLERLSLARGHMTVAQLSQIIEQNSGTLRALSLQQLSFSRYNDWPIALGRLRSQAPLLESISVHCLMAYGDWLTANGDEPRSHVIFPGLVSNPVVPGSGGRSMTWTTKKWKGEKRVFRASYRGPGMDKALEMLVKEAQPIYMKNIPA